MNLNHQILGAYRSEMICTMGWLRLVGSLKLQVSFATEPYERDHILKKRPIFFEGPTNCSHPIWKSGFLEPAESIKLRNVSAYCAGVLEAYILWKGIYTVCAGVLREGDARHVCDMSHFLCVIWLPFMCAYCTGVLRQRNASLPWRRLSSIESCRQTGLFHKTSLFSFAKEPLWCM